MEITLNIPQLSELAQALKEYTACQRELWSGGTSVQLSAIQTEHEESTEVLTTPIAGSELDTPSTGEPAEKPKKATKKPKAKTEPARMVTETMYCYHSESDSYVKLNPGEDVPKELDMGELIPVSKETFDAAMAREAEAKNAKTAEPSFEPIQSIPESEIPFSVDDFQPVVDEPLAEPAVVDAPPVTLGQLANAGVKYLNAHPDGVADLQNLLKKHGAQTFRTIPHDKFDAFVADFRLLGGEV